jgi:arylsulfatase A-like enzyme
MTPNILLIHCHDLGDHIGCYRTACTPVLDQLAADGVVFDRYFAASPTCSPSRGAMLSGKLPHRNGLMALASGGHWVIDPATKLLPQLFKEAGYWTASVGIWHVNETPLQSGVDVVDPTSTCEPATERALALLRERPADQPFLMMLGYAQPHLPFTEPATFPLAPADVPVPPYLDDHPRIRHEMACFHSDVNRVDACVGRLLATLDDRGLADNTLVVFTSDHGIGMPFAKGTLYDAGLKIPLVMRWPGRLPAGRRVPGLAGNVDLLPTLADAAGIADRGPDGLDGHSQWPAASAGSDCGHPQLFAEQTWHDYYEPMRAIRTDRYKLIRNFEPGVGLQVAADILQTEAVDVMRQRLLSYPRPPLELFDLETDPDEQRNLAGTSAAAAIEAELCRALNSHLEADGDPILAGPVPAPPGYWEHFLGKPVGPGRLPTPPDNEHWLTVKWPPGASRHRCSPAQGAS